MRFTLTYRGPLKANRGVADKHALRRHFHTQLKALWAQPPLTGFSEVLAYPSIPGRINLLQEVAAFRFAPLVSSRWHLVAELSITLLRPEPPGSVFAQGGDIDNRLKTLLDALRSPKNAGELPKGACPTPEETPFYCLLEDDALITDLEVKTHQLLEPVELPTEAHLLIHVETRRASISYGNLGLP